MPHPSYEVASVNQQVNLDPAVNEAPAAGLLDHDFTRRGFLLAAGAGLAALAAACSRNSGEPTPSTAPDNTEAPTAAPAEPSETAAAPEAPVIPIGNKPLLSSSNPELRRLGERERELGQKMTELMIFTRFPNGDAEALAEETLQQVKDCAEVGVSPRFIMEPDSDSVEGLADSKDELEDYFGLLASKGARGKVVGTWVILPEPSLPDEWGSTDPKLFTANFNLVAGIAKEKMGARIGMMLDSASFPDGGWGSRTYDGDALMAYVNGINRGLVDEFGLQGFPRVSGSTDPHQLIQSAVALRAANSLGTKNIWINTGTYSRENDPDSGKVVPASAGSRRQFLASIAAEARTMRQHGANVKLTLFSENKMPGEADWSYDSAVLRGMVKPFVGQLEKSGVDFSIFDPANK